MLPADSVSQTNVQVIGSTRRFIPAVHNPIDNISCQHILINVVFGWESELLRLRFGMN